MVRPARMCRIASSIVQFSSALGALAVATNVVRHVAVVHAVGFVFVELLEKVGQFGGCVGIRMSLDTVFNLADKWAGHGVVSFLVGVVVRGFALPAGARSRLGLGIHRGECFGLGSGHALGVRFAFLDAFACSVVNLVVVRA